MKAADGRRFGYQVTFFRVGVDPSPSNPSKWAVRDLFMTHLAISDPSGKRYRYAEKLSRGGPGLAGAATDQYRVWNDDWSATLDGNRHVLKAASGRRGGTLVPPGQEAAIDLTLDEGKAPAIHGIGGISQKGAQAGNASHYYSLTRMPTRGSITVDGERFEVTGDSWMDHEFGTSFREPGQRGWDWLSIQLSDGRELMLYQLRRDDGSRDTRSSGTLVGTDGKTKHLDVNAAERSGAGAGALDRRGVLGRRDRCVRLLERHACRRRRLSRDDRLLRQPGSRAVWTVTSGGIRIPASGIPAV